MQEAAVLGKNEDATVFVIDDMNTSQAIHDQPPWFVQLACALTELAPGSDETSFAVPFLDSVLIECGHEQTTCWRS